MKYVYSRVGQSVLTILTVVTLGFWMLKAIPGDTADYIRAQLSRGNQPDPERLSQVVEVYTNVNPDQPLYMQYLTYLGKLVQGSMGRSVYFDEKVEVLLAEALPWTVFVIGTSLLLMYVVGIFSGAVLALKEGSRFDVSFTLGSITFASIPYYIFALALIFLFSYQLQWFPTGGHYDELNLSPGLSAEFIVSVLRHAALPVASFAIGGIGTVALSMRGNSIQIIGDDFVRVAELRGISQRRIATRYVAHNAILPLYTQIVLSIGAVLGGSAILETVFAYKGVGWILYRAFQVRDFPLMLGSFIMLSTAVIVAALIADLTYSKIDPRISLGGEGSESY